MKLRFYARGDQLAAYPGQYLIPGNAKRYIGRQFVPAVWQNGVIVQPASNPAKREPDEFDSHSPDGDRAAWFCRDGALWPADEATAQFCNCEFQPVEFADGEWVPVVKKKSASKADS